MFQPRAQPIKRWHASGWRVTYHGTVMPYKLALLDRAGPVPLGLSHDGNYGDHRVMTMSHHGRCSIQVAAAP